MSPFNEVLFWTICRGAVSSISDTPDGSPGPVSRKIIS